MAKFINDGEVEYGSSVVKIGGLGKRLRNYVCDSITKNKNPACFREKLQLRRGLFIETGSMVIRLRGKPRRNFVGMVFIHRKTKYYISETSGVFRKDREYAVPVSFSRIYK